MLTLALATLALGTSVRQQANYVLPLYDLVTSMQGSVLTANFSASNSTPNINMLTFYFVNGDTSHFTPDGGWHQITPDALTSTGNVITMVYRGFSSPTPQGTLWVQYTGGANDSPFGAEQSFVAAQYGLPTGVGHSSRPGAIVPIIKKAGSFAESDTQNGAGTTNVPISFDLFQPFGGSWGNSSPNFWQSNGNQLPQPGNGWQNLGHGIVTTQNGNVLVQTTANANNGAGYYAVGCVETYVPNQFYNPHNSQWTEFSGVIRQFGTL